MGSAVVSFATSSGNRAFASWRRRVPVPGMPPYMPAQQYASGKLALLTSIDESRDLSPDGVLSLVAAALPPFLPFGVGLPDEPRFSACLASCFFASNFFRTSGDGPGVPSGDSLSPSESAPPRPPPPSTTTFSEPLFRKVRLLSRSRSRRSGEVGVLSARLTSGLLSGESSVPGEVEFRVFLLLDLAGSLPPGLSSSPACTSGSGSSVSIRAVLFFFTAFFLAFA
mmetsp:Transcript_93693/g.286685  ORF Transcript_93693/g.286685 Transcript_93693/m.286685 type:complete len:225 (-) Transcript_93693:1340-2014(-)